MIGIDTFQKNTTTSLENGKYWGFFCKKTEFPQGKDALCGYLSPLDRKLK